MGAAMLGLAESADAAPSSQPLMGVGAWGGPSASIALEDSGAGWYHNWALTHDWLVTPAGCEYVPMVRDLSLVTPANMADLTDASGSLLTFLEADKSGAGYVSPSAALEVWPQLEATGRRLGSPTTSTADQAGGWLDEFFQGASQQGRRVDFVAVAWRPWAEIVSGSSVSAAVTALREFLGRVHLRHGTPLWLIDYNLSAQGATVTSTMQADFLGEAASMMSSLGVVDRWAWYSLQPDSSLATAPLYGSDHALTAVGERFRELTGAGQSNEEPSEPVDRATRTGVGTWADLGASRHLAETGTPWFYTWGPNHEGIVPPDGCEFIPMIWGMRDLTQDVLGQLPAGAPALLGFNEPDLDSESNIPVGQALDAWPQLEATGLRLGAPAVSQAGHVGGSWLDQFMRGVRDRGLRVDFIPLHWYLPESMVSSFTVARAVDDLRLYLTAVHNRYRLPIWLTEFSLVVWERGNDQPMNDQTQAEFLDAATAMLATLPFVERWAWFAMHPKFQSDPSSLYDMKGRLTLPGAAFRQVTNTTVPVAAPPAGQPKAVQQGTVMWASASAGRALADSGARWFRTYSFTQEGINSAVSGQLRPGVNSPTGGLFRAGFAVPAGCEFVPMVGTRAALAALEADPTVIGSGVQALLTFDQPDLASKADMSVEEALDLWPALEATGLRLGAPLTSGGSRSKWLLEFMNGIRSRGHRVDFVPLEWYPPASAMANDDVTAMLDDLDRAVEVAYLEYFLPVWVTAWSLIDWSTGQTASASKQADFLAAADDRLSRLGRVERVAWFSLEELASNFKDSALHTGKSLTKVGKRFRSLAQQS